VGIVDWFEIVGVLVCVGFSALYSGSETALTALGKTGAQKLLEEDPTRNRALLLWVNHPYRMLTAILVGNNIANITASALATGIAYGSFGVSAGGAGEGAVAAAVAVTVGVMTFLILTFGEIAPKMFAKANAERWAVYAIRLVAVTDFLFRPLTLVYAKLTLRGLQAVGVNPDSDGVTVDDIEFRVNLAAHEGTLDEEQERLLTSVFEYGDTTVKEVMVPRVNIQAVPDDIEYSELLRTLVDCGHSRIPVFKESIDEIIGVFYAKDLLRYEAEGGKPADFELSRFLREPVFVPESKKVDKLLAELRERHIHLAVTVDEFGGTAGVVTLEDIIEEFFGEIQDEFDHEEPMILTDEQNSVHICDARVDLDELGEKLDLDFGEDHDYESLGGFVSDLLGEVPDPGASLDHDTWRFTVLEAEPTHIVTVRVEPLDENGAVSSGEKAVEDDEIEAKPSEVAV